MDCFNPNASDGTKLEARRNPLTSLVKSLESRIKIVRLITVAVICSGAPHVKL